MNNKPKRGRRPTPSPISDLRKGSSVFIPVPDGKDKEAFLKAWNLKCWREAKRSGKEFRLAYDNKQGKEGVKIHRKK